MTNLWQRISASAGIGAALCLAISYAITFTAVAKAAAPDAEYVRALVAERMKWEWVTFLRLVGGVLILSFMGSLSSRLRVDEGGPGRLASAAFGLGVVWAGVWLLSAFFNSASIMLATSYDDPGGSRIAGILARETPYVLTPIVTFALLLATSTVVLQSGGFAKSYRFGTAGLAVLFLVLAVIDWAGPGSLAPIVVALALAWTGATSVMLVRGAR